MASPKDVARQWMDAFNAHDEGRMAELTADDATMSAPGDTELRGRDAVTGYAMAWLSAFPDARITMHQELVDGQSVGQRFTFEGTHTGPLESPAGTIPPTGRRLTGRGIQVLEIDGDEASDIALYFDQVQVLTQLGLMPEPARA
jgi:predicted ester cyclase